MQPFGVREEERGAVSLSRPPRSLHGDVSWAAAGVVLAAFVQTGCEVPRNQEAPAHERRWQEDGVRIVESRRPVRGTVEMHPARLWSRRQNPSPEGKGTWDLPAVVRVLGDRIFVLDRQARELVVLDRAGEVRRRAGGPGEGPGEMKDPREMEALADRVVVLDRGRGQLLTYGPRGDHLGASPLPSVSLGMFPAGPDAVVLRALEGRSEAFRLVHLEEAGPARHSESDSTFVTRMTGLDESHLVPEGARPCVRWDGGRTHVARLSCFVPVVDLFAAATGEIVRRIRLDDGPIPTAGGVVDSVRREVTARVRSVDLAPEAADRVIRRTIRGYRYHRRFRALRPTGDLLFLWEQSPSWSREAHAPAVVHVFTEDGTYLTALHFSSRWEDFDVDTGTDRLYAIAVRRETGLRSVSAWRLPEFLAGTGVTD